MNFATATKEELLAAGYAVKSIRKRRPRKGELICERVGFKTKRGSQQWRDRSHIESPSAYAVVMGNGWTVSDTEGQLICPLCDTGAAPSGSHLSDLTYKRFPATSIYFDWVPPI